MYSALPVDICGMLPQSGFGQQVSKSNAYAAHFLVTTELYIIIYFQLCIRHHLPRANAATVTAVKSQSCHPCF